MTPRIVYHVDGKTITLELDKDEVIIGRDRGSDLVINRPSISRRHARIYRDGDSWRIADLGSTFGTRVNDLEQADAVLREGDTILLSDNRLTFTYHSTPKPSLAPETPAGTSANTIFQSAVDFSAIAKTEPDAGHLQKLLTLVTRASKSILASPSVDETFRIVLDLVFEHLEVQRGVIMLWDAAKRDLSVERVRGVDPEASGSMIPFSRTIAEKVIRDRVAVLTRDAQSDQRFAGGESVFALDIHSAMAAPLWNGDDVEGLIHVDAVDRGAFDKSDLDLLSALGNLLAVAIQHSRLQASMVKQQIARRRLERYHSPAVVDLITGDSEGSGNVLMADERDVTVVFADVVDFSSRCEKMLPRDVADLLNRYFSEMADVVFRHGGTLDKFIGDCLMAVFGAPLATEDHALRAAEAVLEMRDALARLNELTPAEQRLEFRVGVHSGRVVAGDIGSLQRSDYTVLGGTVNLAARLESHVAQPGDIVISDATRIALRDGFDTRLAGKRRLKGIADPVSCHLLLGRKNPG